MKRFAFIILSICLLSIFTLGGCSCTGDTLLEFNNADIKNIKKEVLTYDVSFEKTYKVYNRASTVNESLLPDYQNGQLVMEYSSEGKELPANVETNINYDDTTLFHYVKTTLTLDVSVQGTTYNDKIVSEVYFHSAEWAYSPVYSKTTVKNTFIAMDQERIQAVQSIYQYTTTYRKDNYLLTKKVYNPSQNEDINLIDVEQFDQSKLIAIQGNGSSNEYTARHAIDNVQLLFALRNINISKGSSASLPVCTYMYNEPQSLIIINESQPSINSKIKYNGVDKDVEIPVNSLEISLTGTTNGGPTKYVSIQNKEADGILNNALPVEYAEPVFESASFQMIGALVYKLSDVETIYK